MLSQIPPTSLPKMAVLFGVVLIAVCCARATVSTGCEGKVVNKITEVLTEVRDWDGLAGELNAKRGTLDEIRTTCRAETSNLARCYRRELVNWYCDSTGYELGVIVENLAQALEEIGHKRQAADLRKLFSGATTRSGSQPTESPVVAEEGTCSSDDPDCSGTATPSFTPPPDEKWREEEPAEDELLLIKYKEADGKEKEYRLLQNIQMRWKDIGRRLGIGSAVLNGYETRHRGDTEEQCQEVLNHWRNAGAENYPFTWSGVLKILRDVQMGNVAERLEKALSNRV